VSADHVFSRPSTHTKGLALRFVRVSITLAVLGLAGLIPVQQAAAITPRTRGPIASYKCPPVPMWCTRTLKPGITLTHWRATMRSGASQNLYRLSWALGNPHVRLSAASLSQPKNGDIRLNTISRWAASSGPPGLLGAINGDFFGLAGNSWSAGHPSGMLVQSRHVVAFGSGGPGVGYEPDGRMVMGTPSAKPAKLMLGHGQTATVAAFDPGSSLGSVLRDQVVVKTVHTALVNVPSGWDGYLVGGSSAPNPFPSMLRGSEKVSNPSGNNKRETVAGFRFGDAAGEVVTVTLPIEPAPAGSIQLAAGQALVIAIKKGPADTALTRLANNSQRVTVSIDAPAWSSVQDVMGGKPQLVQNGKVSYPTANFDPPMMSSDGWQWEFPHWRPAVAETKTHGWLIITGGVHYGNGVYGWNWGKMLVQLGAQNAMGFDNNSSTELFAPGNGTWTFSPNWERDITEATALSYR
jgi:hypothetical protein